MEPLTLEQRLKNASATFPIGRRVRYYPTSGSSAHSEEVVRTVPWAVGSGDIIIGLSGKSGGVSIDHLEVI